MEQELSFKYKYDGKGNWVERIMYENNNYVAATIREIHYLQ